MFSTFWILSVNSWMQTPAGAKLVDGRFMPEDWWAIVFNPSFPTRLGHTVVGLYITTGFVVLSVAAYYLRRNRFVTESRLMMSATLWLLLALVPLQIFLGDASGLVTREHQPAKLAAIEARWETASRVPLTLFAIPDETNATNRWAIDVPVLGSLILTHDPNGTVKGLKDFPRQDWPMVALPFFAFRIMVGIGLLMLAIVVVGNVLRRGNRLYENNWYLLACQFSVPLGFLAVLAGWVVTETGTAALDGLWPDAHSGFCLAVADRLECRAVADRLYRNIRNDIHWRLCRAVAHHPRRSRGARRRGGGAERPPILPGASDSGGVTHMVDFVPIWTLILGLGIFLYVLLDGFDLGVGILYRFAPDSRARNLMMNSIAPIWDGNETWLILGVVGLLAAFPLAFAILMPALYFPFLIMLLSLIFRGVAFEFRFRDSPHRTLWDHGFAYGSLLATFAQGIALGAFIQGFQVDGRVFSGSSLDCFTPFSILTGICLIFGYALLGAGLVDPEDRGRLAAPGSPMGDVVTGGVAVAVLIVSIWTPFMSDQIRARWFSWPNFALLAPVPIVTALIALWTWRAIMNEASHYAPFAGSITLFVMSYLGIAISLWPMIVPHRFTLWEAASAPSTQAFLLVGTLILLPVILMYTAWSYWVFRGKVRADIGYH